MQYLENANGTTISPRVGEEFQIVLNEVRTAGYKWITTLKGEPACNLLNEENSPSAKAGGSGTHLWQFKAIKVGSVKIELHYARPWGKTEKPEKIFTLEVQVRP